MIPPKQKIPPDLTVDLAKKLVLGLYDQGKDPADIALVLMTASAHAFGLSAAERNMAPGEGVAKFISLAGTYTRLVAAAEAAHREAIAKRKKGTR